MSNVTLQETFSEQELSELAAMHLACLPDSTVSFFGKGYLRDMYAYLGRAPSEAVFVAKDDAGNVQGSAMISLARPSLGLRLALKSGLLLRLIFKIWQPRVLRALFESSKDFAIDLPEFVFIFVDASARRRGVADELLVSAEAFLRGRGITVYGLRTNDTEDAAAMRLYEKHGFEITRRFTSGGNPFVWMERRLDA